MKRSILLLFILVYALPGFAQLNNFQWAIGIGGPAAEQGSEAVTDSAGNIYTCGFFSGTVDFDRSPSAVFNLTSTGGNDMYLACYSNDGDLKWAFALGNSGNEAASDISLDNTGSIIITGTFSGVVDFDPTSPQVSDLTSNGASEIFLAKYSLNGQYLWAYAFGSPSFDNLPDLATDNSGDIILTGSFINPTDFDPDPLQATILNTVGQGDIFLAKYTSNGQLMWAFNVGNTDFDAANDVRTDVSGNIYIAGTFRLSADFNPSALQTNTLTSAGSNDFFVAKYNPAGDYLWAFRCGSSGSFNSDIARCIDVDRLTGDILVGGVFQGTVDFDPGASVVSWTSVGSSNAFLCRYTSAGNFVWVRSIGNTGIFGEEVTGVKFDNSGNLALTGFFSGTMNLNPAGSAVNVTAVASTDVFVARYNSSGFCIWGFGLGDISNDISDGVTTDPFGNVIVTGSLRAAVDFNPDPAVTYSISASSSERDNYLAKYGPCASVSLATVSSSIEQDAANSYYYTRNTCNNLVARVQPYGALPVSGLSRARVWVKASPYAINGEPCVQRNYQHVPGSGAAARITLYFTQSEFNAFNAAPGSTLDLPADGMDAANRKANLLILHYPDTSYDNSGNPESFSGNPELINPADADIVWNVTASRWEVSFISDSKGGFFAGAFSTFSSCPGSLIQFPARTSGTTYQWELNTGSGFTALADNANYSGTNTASLSVTGVPTSYYGYQYRCVVDGIPGDPFTLKFAAIWNGTADINWHNPVNWGGCGVLPDQYTDVYIPSGKVRYPAVSSAATIRSLSASAGATVTVQSNVTLDILK